MTQKVERGYMVLRRLYEDYIASEKWSSLKTILTAVSEYDTSKSLELRDYLFECRCGANQPPTCTLYDETVKKWKSLIATYTKLRISIHKSDLTSWINLVFSANLKDGEKKFVSYLGTQRICPFIATIFKSCKERKSDQLYLKYLDFFSEEIGALNGSGWEDIKRMAENELDIYMCEYFDHESRYLCSVVVAGNLKEGVDRMEEYGERARVEGTYEGRAPGGRGGRGGGSGKLKGGNQRDSARSKSKGGSPVRKGGNKREDRRKKQSDEKQSKMSKLTKKMKGIWDDVKNRNKKTVKRESQNPASRNVLGG